MRKQWFCSKQLLNGQSWAGVIFLASPRHKGTYNIARLYRAGLSVQWINTGAVHPSPLSSMRMGGGGQD